MAKLGLITPKIAALKPPKPAAPKRKFKPIAAPKPPPLISAKSKLPGAGYPPIKVSK